jgi:hypothetical protein
MNLPVDRGDQLKRNLFAQPRFKFFNHLNRGVAHSGANIENRWRTSISPGQDANDRTKHRRRNIVTYRRSIPSDQCGLTPPDVVKKDSNQPLTAAADLMRSEWIAQPENCYLNT